MNTSSPFIAGGGWVTRETIARPKARFFGFASLMWLVASLSATPLLGAFWPVAFGFLSWLGAAVIAVQLILVALATAFWLTEQPRVVIEYEPNPNHDPRNLY